MKQWKSQQRNLRETTYLTAYVTEYIKLSLFICKAMTSLAKVYITLAGLDYASIEVIGKGLTDSSVLGPQLWAA